MCSPRCGCFGWFHEWFFEMDRTLAGSVGLSPGDCRFDIRAAESEEHSDRRSDRRFWIDAARICGGVSEKARSADDYGTIRVYTQSSLSGKRDFGGGRCMGHA